MENLVMETGCTLAGWLKIRRIRVITPIDLTDDLLNTQFYDEIEEYKTLQYDKHNCIDLLKIPSSRGSAGVCEIPAHLLLHYH